jgi:flagellin-specific chaperone FliS
MTNSVRAYRNSATEGATHLDILLACYDALAEAIRMAGEAAAKDDIATRCRHSQRALLLIGHLESWVSLLDDPELGGSLVSFYEYLRAEILRLQASGGLDKFISLALVVCETRAAWQKKGSIELSRLGANEEVSLPIGDSDDATSRFLASA